jgi:succinate dehydrogenase / fumarate reductase membrane anchor subunit
MSSLRTPLSNVKGHGSAKEGTHHFWVQRLTALALVPLVLWLCFSIAALPASNYTTIQSWVGNSFNAVLLVLIIVAAFYHAKLGLQMVIEDYISSHATRTAGIILSTFICILLACLGVFSVLKIAFTA